MRQVINRHPLEVEGVGVMQHGSQKTYMFSVLWSDQNNVLIYRTFEAFRNFQKELKRIFPLEAGALKKSERTIPKLKESPRKVSKRRDSRRFLEKLQWLVDYSQSLLKLDAKISQSVCVVKFFTLQDHDLNPSFPENSLVILPSEKKNNKSIITNNNPDVSGPIICDRYRCTEDFETIDLKNHPFIVKKHEILDVMVKESTGWWLVENEDKQIAWFPAPYLKCLSNTDNIYNTEDCHAQGTFCVVLKAYEAQNTDELSVSIGVVVEVLKKSDHGWWLISYNKRKGYIPSIYLKPYRNPCEKFQNILNKDRNASTPNLYEGIQNGEESTFYHHRSSLDDQKVEMISNPSDRERSESLGAVSMMSDRSNTDSDIDCLPGRYGKSNFSFSDHSIYNDDPEYILPKIPARPDPNEIIQKCSTVTRRIIQKSMTRLNTVEDSQGMTKL
ncbi:NADPH oxidase organizer 1-like [Discoglossus pictus]